MAMPRILAVGTANPPNRFTQAEALALAGYADERRRGFFLNSGIEGRYLAIDRDGFRPTESLDELQARYRKASVELGCQALRKGLAGAGRSPRDLHFLATTTCTGRLCPSLDAILIRELRLRSDLQRVHVGDTGCASAMVALQQACNHLQAFPDHLAAVVAVEVSSASYYLDDDLETAVANAIFADGAAAVILAGTGLAGSAGAGAGDGPEIVAHRTLVRPEYLDLMGFTFPAGFQRILLSKDIRHIAAGMLAELTDELLKGHGLTKGDVQHWILHSAGRRVIEQAQRQLGLSDGQLAHARTVLRQYGNMSSATVLFVLREVLQTTTPQAGEWGVMIALGPGFAAEGALLQW
ncbi:MAG: type III polyketide synthase [candidate division NC10 bacterium]|nr:type III polyketide synthase [candidate division NC10 bacterium]